MKKIIIMMGSPGSGKGTQAKKLAAKYDYAHLSTGDLIRALSKTENITPAEKEAIEQSVKLGKLVPDWLIYRLVFEEIKKNLDAGRGVILDGAIRTLEQAKKFQEFFQSRNLSSEVAAIEIFLSNEDSFSRLTKRRICNQCGDIIPWLSATRHLDSCPQCGGHLTVRQDDNLEVIRQRIAGQGNESLSPILDYYKGLGVLKTVDGSQDIEAVGRGIDAMLNN